MAVARVTINLVDGEGHSSEVTIYLPDTLALDKLAIAAAAYGDLIEDISEAVVISASAAFTLFSGSGTPLAASDVEEKARFVWGVANTTKKVLQSIPAFIKAKILPNSNQVDLADADVDAFYDAMVTGLTVGADTFVPKDSEGRDINGLRAAKQAYTRSRS